MNQRSSRSTEWAGYATVTQLGAEMVAPIVVGLLLDYQFDTTPWLTVGGAVVGLVGGLMHLVYLTNRIESSVDQKDRQEPESR